MKTPDEQIIEIYKDTRNYAATAREMNRVNPNLSMNEKTISKRIKLCRQLGWDLPSPECTIEKCTKRHYAKGFCAQHHQQYLRGTLNGKTR